MLRKILKFTLELYFFVPYFLISIYSIFKNSSYRYPIKKKEGISSDVIVLGNGPSLETDIDKILVEKGDFFCVNHFADSQWFVELKPQYYIFLDPYFWSDKANDEYKEKREKTFKELNEKVSWKITVYLPSYATDFLVEKLNNKNITIKKYSGIGLETYPSFLENFLLETSIFSPYGINVVLHSLFISIHLGYKKIKIYGIDTSVFKNLNVDQETNQVYVLYQHFYGESKVYQNESGLSDSNLTLAECLKKEYLNFKTYELIARYAVYRNVDIVNCSSFSYVDAIRRNSVVLKKDDI